jgi:hypothetical protein
MLEETRIRARTIELVDEAGTPRVLLQASSDGTASLTVHSIGGEGTGMMASIGIHKDGSPFLVLGSEDKGKVFASVLPAGPGVTLIDENGKQKTFTIASAG